MTVALVTAGALVLLWAVWLGVSRVRRLHRLHRRLDAARAGLEAALRRRVALATAAGVLPVGGVDVGGVGLGPEREAAENALGRALAGLDRAGPADLAELGDAERQVALARRVHNDAVRDTLGLRSRRMVRWLRLAGTAPMPAYFEIADPEAGGRASERAETSQGVAGS
ncbi:NUDIX hydrolase [Pseudonocardia sp. GCM10023141]|uniref:NUDIX hydrolase n=1 Tax=Pseudonocardia sp. GCM10023141 TaxID=3252653 RepID=UPI003616AFDC